MLTIRQEQLQALEQSSMNNFVDELAEHFRQALPKHHAALGAEGTREAIRYGIARAKEYGVTDARCVVIYVRLLFLFGRDYDTDPDLPWAGAVLGNPIYIDEVARIEQLVLASRAYLETLAFEGTE